MKSRLTEVMEGYRLRTGAMGSDESFGMNGVFVVPQPVGGAMRIIVSDIDRWEHASVSIGGSKKTPTWDQMDWVKRQFWDDAETVMQLHPPRHLWVSLHATVLHLWKPVGIDILLPPTYMVGPVGMGEAKDFREATEMMRTAIANPEKHFPDMPPDQLPPELQEL